METKLITTNSKDIIIFLTGWGSDASQFKNIKSKENLLICWDYSDLCFTFDFSNYTNVYLIAYSAGVYVAGLIKDKLPKIKYSIAINGNPKIFDEYFGIDNGIINEMLNLNIENYIDFRRKYLVIDEDELTEFNKYPSCRSFESCINELNILKKYYQKSTTEFEFDIALLSDSDKIFEPEKQKEYFKNYIVIENAAHNVFCKYNDFSKLIEFANLA